MGLAASMQRLSTGDKLATAGQATADVISISQRLRGQIRGAEASNTALNNALAYLNTADDQAENVIGLLQRAFELSQSALDSFKNPDDRAALEQELQAIKSEITDLSQQSTFLGKQTVGREVLVSYDANSDHIRFWQPTGEGETVIERDFSADGRDAKFDLINFDPTEAYSMSRNGKSLFYLSNVAGDAAGTTRMHRYDIDSNKVYTGNDLFATGDTLFVDEEGSLYVNGASTLYTVGTDSLSRTATGVADLTTGEEFTVYKGDVIYHRNADQRIVSTDLATLVSTNLITAALPTFAAGLASHAFSGSGRYIADESAAGTIRVTDTRTGNTTSANFGGANAVTEIQFNADGDRIYFVNQETNAIHMFKVSTDSNGNISLSPDQQLIQGRNGNSFQGFDIGGANYDSITEFVLQEGTTTVLDYEAVELNLYSLGINNIHIDTLADADVAATAIKEAVNRAAASRTLIRASAARFSFTQRLHQEFISEAQVTVSRIRDVDIAKESIEFTSFQLRQEIASSVLREHNNLKMNVLRLFQ